MQKDVVLLSLELLYSASEHSLQQLNWTFVVVVVV